MSARIKIDWDAVEPVYRLGIKSFRQMADEFGCTSGRIAQVAKERGWTRDLSAKVKAKAEEKLNKSILSAELSEAKQIAEKEIVEANAQMQANIILAHRKDIGKYRELAAKLLNELQLSTDGGEALERLSELLYDTAGEDANDAQRKRKELMDKVLSTGGRIDSFKKLAETFKILVGIEREAFGIDEKQKSPSTGDINISF